MSAVAVAFLLALLGVFSSVGYHVYSIEGVSFAPNFDYGYVQVRFGLDAVHNPLLYPYYWLNGKGRVLGNFSMAYFVEGWSEWGPRHESKGEWSGNRQSTPGFPAPHGLSPEERRERFILLMTTWGILPNLVFLLLVAAVIEVVSERLLYLTLFAGIVGFTLAGIDGMLVGLIAGGAFNIIYRLKLPEDNALARCWHYIWRS